MKHQWFKLVLLLAICGFPCGAFSAEPSPQATALLEQIQAMQKPVLDASKRDDAAYINSYVSQLKSYEQKRNDLIKDFFTRFPDHPQAMPLMSERWFLLANRGQRQLVLDETEPLLPRTSDPKDRAEILFVRAAAKVMLGRSDESTPFVMEFVNAAPKDERGGELLVVLGQTEHNPAKKTEIYRKVADNYPNTMYGQMAKGMLRQMEGLGKPFELTFADAISGKQISVQKDLKGKVVVIDFWATWCGPCVEEMPNMKSLYSLFKDKGVEFVGISLDEPEAQGGRTKLTEFVKKNEIAWPQYYQGDAWAGEFSSAWGITSIPRVFIVDKQGKLASTEARGQLREMISRLLKDQPAVEETGHGSLLEPVH